MNQTFNRLLKLNALIRKASESKFYLWFLNVLLSRAIPFNKPHRFKITSISARNIEIEIPYNKSNLNHLKGLHACALATVSEYATGLLLMCNLDASYYRLIMKSMRMEYHYQGKMTASAKFSFSEEWMEQNVLVKLENQESVLVDCLVNVNDEAGNCLSTCTTQWQIKQWNKVRIKP